MHGQAVWPYLDHDDCHFLEQPDQLVEVAGQNFDRHRLETTEPDVPSERVPAPTEREFPVVGDDDGALLVGVDGDVVVLGGVLAGETGGSRRPTLMSVSVEQGADSDVDVVIEEEAHSPGDRDAWLAPRRFHVLRG